MNEIELKIKWENNLEFSVQAKVGETEWVTILALEENGCLLSMWPNVQKTLESYWKHVLTGIGKDMIGA